MNVETLTQILKARYNNQVELLIGLLKFLGIFTDKLDPTMSIYDVKLTTKKCRELLHHIIAMLQDLETL